MEKKKIEIENFKPENLGPVSYDMTIGDEIRYIESSIINYGDPIIDITKPIQTGNVYNIPVYFKPNDAIVFTTDEIIYICPEVSGIVYARSSLTKLPVLFNIPGLIDPGFRGSITGVMYNFSGHTIELKKMRICQVVFHYHNTVNFHYGVRKISKHQGQRGKVSLIPRTDKEFLAQGKTGIISYYIMYVDGAGNLFKGEVRGKSVIRTFDEATGKRETISIEDSTNNEAELKAILYGIRKILDMGVEYAVIYSDSKLAVQGISGRMEIKAENLIPILEEIWDILPKNYDVVWIPGKKQKAHLK